MAEAVKVAVRVRPYNGREKDMGAKNCITMSGKDTVITNPADGKEKKFTFDYSYDSFVPRDDPKYASQDTVWQDIGVGVLNNAFDGYNCSLFAYGQTGAGKSYSMMGYGPDKGIIPIACSKIFDRISANTEEGMSFKVETAMLEIYMEKIRDLFNPGAGELKVRLDPKIGFFVKDLTKNAVRDFETIERLMEAGSKARTVASTNMNKTSSRAHTIFQITFTQTKLDAAAGKATDKTSVINLVDLAGSERQKGTGASGARLKEGSAINMSLSSLGRVIETLAFNSDPAHKKKKKVPFRDSVLTQLLKNALGGNSKTIMIAAVSPADVNYDETLSTLRYADRAKKIKNKAVVNEDPNERMIRELKEQIMALKAQLGGGGAGMVPGAAGGGVDEAKIREEMERKLREEMEAKMKAEMEQDALATDARARMATDRLKSLGVLTGADLEAARKRAEVEPNIVNLHEDQLMDRQIFHFFDEGKQLRVGRDDADEAMDVTLGGLSIKTKHAVVINSGGRIALKPGEEGAKILVNGKEIDSMDGVELHHRNRVIFGNNHVFLVQIPAEVAAGTAPVEDDVPTDITFEFAINEVNKAQVEAVQRQEAERRAEAERMRKEAEEKVQALEQKMQAERAKAEEEERQRAAALEEKMKKMQEAGEQKAMQEMQKEQEKLMARARKQQEELQKKLEEQIQETERLHAKKQKEMRERTLLDEKLLRTIPLVNEANAIAEEVGKEVTLEVTLMANQRGESTYRGGRKRLQQGPASGAGADESKDGEEDEEDDEEDEDEDEESKEQEDAELDTEVYVLAQPKKKGPLRALWAHEEFMERLYIMREFYQEFLEADRDVGRTGFIDPEEDPFHIVAVPLELGKVRLLLDSLVHALPIQESVAILNHQGKEVGKLLLKLIPHLTPEPPEGDDEDDGIEIEGEDGEPTFVDQLEQLEGRKVNFTLIIEGARSLPKDQSVDVHVKYKFFLDDRWHQTVPVKGKAMNPNFNHRKTFSVVVTKEFLEYVGTQSMVLQVWGTPDDGTAKAGKSARQSIISQVAIDAELKAKQAAAQEIEAREKQIQEKEEALQKEAHRREELERQLAEARAAVGSGAGAAAAGGAAAGGSSDEHMRTAIAAEKAKIEAAQKEEMDRLREEASRAKQEADVLRQASGDAGKGALSELEALKKQLAEEKTAREKAEADAKKAQDDLAAKGSSICSLS